MNATPAKATLSDSAFYTLLGAAAAGIAAYYADVADTPVIAPVIDWGTAQIYAWIPWFQMLPSQAWFIASGTLVGGLFWLIASVVAAIWFTQTTEGGRLEARLKKQEDQRKARRLDLDGFVVRKIRPRQP
jgi:hypothetical protein